MSRPFNKSRYERLLKGLEVTVLPLSRLDLADRADAEYVSKENLRIETLVRHRPHQPIGELAELTASAFYPAATNLYEHGDVPFIRCVDCINHPLISRVQNEAFERIPRAFVDAHASIRTLKRGDIVITKVGSPCYASLVHDYDEVALSRTVLGVQEIRGIDPYYFLIFLRSYHGFSQLVRQREQTIQFQLTLERVRDVEVFLPSESFQAKIAELARSHLVSLRESVNLLAGAERTLLEELGLANWMPPEPLTYTRRAKDILAAARMDAEHFQPRFQALSEHIESKGAVHLRDCVTTAIRRGISPEYDDNGDVLVINSQHVGKTGIELNDNRRTRSSFANDSKNKKARVRKNDVLLNSTGRITIGRCQCLLESTNAIVDNHVAIIRPTSDLDPVYLATFLNAWPGQWQTEAGWTGSSGQIELRPDVIADYIIWNAPKGTQLKIRALVESGHASRRRARDVLERAKHAVEIAIEDSEATALKYLRRA